MTLAADELPIIELSQLLGSENATYRAVPLRFLGSIASVDERTDDCNPKNGMVSHIVYGG